MKSWSLVVLGTCLLLGTRAMAAAPDATIVKDVVAVTVAADGSYTLVEEDTVKIQTAGGAERFGKLERLYNAATTEVAVEAADIVDASGQTHQVPPHGFRDTVAPECRDVPAYSSVRILSVPFPRAAPGMSVHFRVKTTHKTPLMPGQLWETSFFQDSAPLMDSVFDVSFPDSLHLNWQGTGLMQGVAPTVEHSAGRTLWHWQAGPAAPVPDERGMPAAADVTSRVTVSTFSSWEQVGEAFGRLWERATDPTGVDLSAWQSKLHQPSWADIVSLVMNSTQEITLNLPPNEYAPLPVSVAATSSRLTAQDRCVLMLALARANGLPASPGLSTTSETGQVDKSFPTADALTRAVVVVPAAARPWVVDGASDTPGLGLLRPALIDQSILIVSGPSAGWMQTGIPSATDNREVVRLEARLDKEGALSELVQLRQYGAQNAIWRDVLGQTANDEQTDFMTRLVQQISPRAVVSSYYIPTFKPLMDPVSEEVRFDVEPTHGSRTSLRLPMLPERFLASYLPGQEAEPRRQPLVLGFPIVEDKWLHLVLPDGVQVVNPPAAVLRENSIGSYQLTVTTSGRDLWALSRLTLRKTTVTPQEYSEFVELVQTALQAEDTPVSLRHGRE